MRQRACDEVSSNKQKVVVNNNALKATTAKYSRAYLQSASFREKKKTAEKLNVDRDRNKLWKLSKAMNVAGRKKSHIITVPEEKGICTREKNNHKGASARACMINEIARLQTHQSHQLYRQTDPMPSHKLFWPMATPQCYKSSSTTSSMTSLKMSMGLSMRKKHTTNANCRMTDAVKVNHHQFQEEHLNHICTVATASTIQQERPPPHTLIIQARPNIQAADRPQPHDATPHFYQVQDWSTGSMTTGHMLQSVTLHGGIGGQTIFADET
ncbi:hypothetical protein DPMN_086549 [Dreissena polymorpha]|uniref:Uncharacterized protein n=1 Tax=Dreissena polymorpha TaxID=45954 RepID=A0A9D4QVK7_DREPO|nr:hypothetical protein DPMN_086549 [Dreissena polymorpha]